MAILRFITVSLLSFFLLGPILVQFISDIQKPKVLMILDRSESIVSGKDAKFYKTEFLNQWKYAANQLGKDYEVVFLDFGGTIKISDTGGFVQKKTNISQIFDFVNNTYSRQNVGAVVLASDGIFNRGNNPVYKSLNKHTPLYTIGMGDSSIKKDAIIKEANHNSIAYLNNSFPVELGISAYDCLGASTILTLSSEGKVLYNEKINIIHNDFFKSIVVNIDADKPGTKHIVASLSGIQGETSLVNNRKDIFVDIIDGREKILFIFNGPHPDIAAIKDAIASNQNFEIISMPWSQVKISDLNSYSVAILHQLPGKGKNAKDIIFGLRKLKIPIWCIIGNETAIEQLSLISSSAVINRNQGRINESQAFFNNRFNAFTLEENTIKTIDEFPPLKSPYGIYASSNNTEILAFQKIGQVKTQTPIWTLSNQNGEKSAYLNGEGFWRWRMFDFKQNESFMASNELVSKTIQYLAIKEDKRKFKVYPVKNTFDEDESIHFVAEIYNANYEPVNTSEVKLNLFNSEKKVFKYTFSKHEKVYRLDLGLLPMGIYTFKAETEGIKESVTGKFIVTPLQTEWVNTRADFPLLRQIAINSQGLFFNDREINRVIQTIKENPTITSISYSERRTDELINLKWVFFLLILLLSAEWLIRKYEGLH